MKTWYYFWVLLLFVFSAVGCDDSEKGGWNEQEATECSVNGTLQYENGFWVVRSHVPNTIDSVYLYRIVESDIEYPKDGKYEVEIIGLCMPYLGNEPVAAGTEVYLLKIKSIKTAEL